MGRCPAAHRNRVGEGVRVGSGEPTRGVAIRGEPRSRRPTHANLGGEALRPAPVGAYPAGASAYGVEQMLGDVWEWTSSTLQPWPGFTPMIYQRYSQPFFGGDYRVLRGGSWAVESGDPAAQLPQLGSPVSAADLQRRPVGVVCRGTIKAGAAPDVPPPRLAGTRNLGLLIGARPAAWSSGAVVCPAPAKARPVERRRLGSRVFRRRDTAALAQRRTVMGRRLVRFRCAGAAQPLRGGGGALGDRRHADRSQRDRAVHRWTVAVVAQRNC